MAPHQGINCANCVFFERTNEGQGECRRYAPHPNNPTYVPKSDALGAFKPDTHWPKVYDRNWCGQFSSPQAANSQNAQ